MTAQKTMVAYHHYAPREKAHLVADHDSEPDDRTLCGIDHGGDVTFVGDDPDHVLPKYKQYCQRCRAAYVKAVLDNLDIDVEDLEEGDVIEYWTHDDPTKANSSLCLRKNAVIVETPPWEMRAGRDSSSTITTGYKVKHDSITSATARFDRIWRVNHMPAEDILDDRTLENALAGALSTAYGKDND